MTRRARRLRSAPMPAELVELAAKMAAAPLAKTAPSATACADCGDERPPVLETTGCYAGQSVCPHCGLLRRGAA